MNSFSNLVLRNLRIFYRDKWAVFFSLMSQLIIVMLYVLFLGKVQSDAISSYMGGSTEGVDEIVYTWILSGLLAVSVITLQFSVLSTVVNDKEQKILMDFLSSPVKRSHIVGAYIISSVIITLVICSIMLFSFQLLMMIIGIDTMSIITTIKVLGVVAFGTVCFSPSIYYFSNLINTMNTLSAMLTVVGTLIGFITGVYIPIGQFSTGVQNFMKIFPPTHLAVVIRNIACESSINNAFAAAPDENASNVLNISMGIDIEIFGQNASILLMLSYVFAFGLVFFILSVLKFRKQKY